MKKVYAILCLALAHLGIGQVVLNSGILTNYNVNFHGNATSNGGCDIGCQTFSDIGSPYNTYIINTSGTATVNAASGSGILCDNNTSTGNSSATAANATYTLTSNCTYTITSRFGWGTGSCPDSRADAGDNLSIAQSGGTTLSQGADIAPGSCGPTHNATASATGCGNAILTATLVVQTGASVATVTISYTSNRADEVCAFQILANLSGCGAMVLPVNLAAFTANKTSENEILVKWITTKEINNDYFVLEYSLDGKNFVNYKQIKGNGNSSEEREYTCLFTEDVGTTNPYFRLKQIDYNGKYQYSTVIGLGNYIGSLFTEDQGNFYYNSDIDRIVVQIKLEKAQFVTFSIYDSCGKELSLIKKYLNVGTNEIEILPPESEGVYTLVSQPDFSAPIHKRLVISK